ncbi:MAG: ADP-glyceromanno-heptose 6-epimerase [Gemmatimonadetes bacterium]|nr:ADP-glyceromanno-heptose 6-epimerase [Gemmatimonadota bacterium]
MIAVTGAAGFIGSNLARRLAPLGEELVLVDHPMVPAKAGNARGLERFRLAGHLDFLSELERGALSPRVVYHLGACSSTTETNWAYLVENNITYSQRVWRWCAANGRRLVYASSAATYGDGIKGFDDRTHPRDLAPLNLYGRSKNDFDRWALDEAEAGRPTPPTWAGVKFFNVYGPNELHKGSMASVVWHARRQVLATGEMRLFKSNDPAIRDGEQRRDFVYVGDNLDHLTWLAAQPRGAGLFNSGTGTARTFLDLAGAVFDALGRERRIRFIDMPANLTAQYQNYTQADMSRLRGAGFAGAATPIERGVRETLATAAGD